MKILKSILSFFKRLFTFSFKMKCNTELQIGTSEREKEEVASETSENDVLEEKTDET